MDNIIERLNNLTDTRRQWGNLRHKLAYIVFIGLVWKCLFSISMISC